VPTAVITAGEQHDRTSPSWIDVAKENIEYFFVLMLMTLTLHSYAAYDLFGVRSSTFVTFAILTALSAIGHVISREWL
jgi:hypothetical protein